MFFDDGLLSSKTVYNLIKLARTLFKRIFLNLFFLSCIEWEKCKRRMIYEHFRDDDGQVHGGSGSKDG